MEDHVRFRSHDGMLGLIRTHIQDHLIIVVIIVRIDLVDQGHGFLGERGNTRADRTKP